jgi:hypothetical protein
MSKTDVPILQQPVAKLANADLLQSIPWGHHALLMEKSKTYLERYDYCRICLAKPTKTDRYFRI